MSTTNLLWRIVNPSLTPHQVAFECGDEQAALREYASRNAQAQGYVLHKSEDDGKSWVGVPVRAPDVAVPIAVSQAAHGAAPSAAPPIVVGGELERGELGGSSEAHETRSSTKHRK
jgi:hypothetical protein